MYYRCSLAPQSTFRQPHRLDSQILTSYFSGGHGAYGAVLAGPAVGPAALAGPVAAPAFIAGPSGSIAAGHGGLGGVVRGYANSGYW